MNKQKAEIFLNNKKIKLLNNKKHIFSITSLINEPIKDGLLVWLDGRDGSCEEKTTVWLDRSGNGYNATLSNFGNFTNNEWTGYGLSQRVSGRTVKLDNSSIPLPNNEITLEVYGINFNNDLFSGLIADNTKSYYYWTNSKNAILWKNNKEFSTSGYVMNDNIITHLAFVYHEKYIDVYKNGKLLLTSKITNPTTVSSFLNGRVFCPYCSDYSHEVFSTRLYNRALSESEIINNYNYEKSIYRGHNDSQLKMTSLTKISVENEWNTEDFEINFNVESQNMSSNEFTAYLLKDGEIISTKKVSNGMNNITYSHINGLNESSTLEFYVIGDGIKTNSIYWEINDETEVPYISLYKVGPNFIINQDIEFEYFIADSNYIEFREVDLPDGYSYPLFDVEFYVDDILIKRYENLNSKDHFTNLGKFEPGEHNIRAVCYDKLGRQSIDLWHFFRVLEDNIEEKVYYMTENDLTTYNILNIDNGPDYRYNGGTFYNSISELYKNPETDVTLDNGTVLKKYKVHDLYSRLQPYWNDVTFDDYYAIKENSDLSSKRTKIKSECQSVVATSESTRAGLQQLFDDTKAAGYTKLVLLPGTYRIQNLDGEACLKCPDNFTIDLNGAKIKLNGFTGSGCTMMEIRCCYDSHVINGIFEGDFFEHDYTGSPNNSEWVSGIQLCGSSKYSSYENLRIQHFAGYGTMCGTGGPKESPGAYVYDNIARINYKTLSESLYIKKDGTEINRMNRCTCDYVDISNCKSGYLSISRYLGYQGNSGNHWEQYWSFYDENKNFIIRYLGFQYRVVKIPSNAKYLRITFLQSAATLPTDMSLQHFRVPTCCSYKNIIHENCRCVGMAPAAAKQFIVEDCEWYTCGRSGAFCAYDAEDGWDMMQDFYHKNLNFHNNNRNDFLICAGKNFVMENFKSGTIYLYPRAIDSVVRNNDYTSLSNKYSFSAPGSMERKGLPRIYNNKGILSLNTGANTEFWMTGKNKLSKRFLAKRNEVCGRSDNGCIYKSIQDGISKPSNDGGYVYAYSGENIQSRICNASVNFGNTVANNCYIENCKGAFQSKHYYKDCIIKNCSGSTSQYADIGINLVYENCILKNLQLTDGYWSAGKEIIVKNCIIKNDNLEFFNKTCYSTKYPILFENCYFEFTNNKNNAIFYYYDNRSYCDDPENSNYYEHGAMITIKNCTLKLNDNKVFGFGNGNTIGGNKFNFTFENNRLIGTESNHYFIEPGHTSDFNVHKNEIRDTDFELNGIDIFVAKKFVEVNEENYIRIMGNPVNATNQDYTVTIDNDNIEFNEDYTIFIGKKEGTTKITVQSITYPNIISEKIVVIKNL